MPNQLSPWLLALLLSATSACAQFEGVLEMQMSLVSQDGSERRVGTIRLALAQAGMRGEITSQKGLKRVVLCKTATPNTNYLIDDANKTYTEIDLSPPNETAGQRLEPDSWTVAKLGQEKLLNYATQHVLARPKRDPAQSMELWIATGLLDFETYRRLQASSGGAMGGEAGLNQALKAAGAEGMPLKVVVTTQAGVQVRLETVKVEKKSLPAATFDIPAGYTSSSP